jgi:hypothetical protein
MRRRGTAKAEASEGTLRIETTFLLGWMISVIIVLLLAYASPAEAHPGGLAADGCHNDRQNGGRHCHGAADSSSRQAPTVQRARPSGGTVHYQNCSEARAAGAAPVRRGQPGYASHLDRDNDGIGCE